MDLRWLGIFGDGLDDLGPFSSPLGIRGRIDDSISSLLAERLVPGVYERLAGGHGYRFGPRWLAPNTTKLSTNAIIQLVALPAQQLHGNGRIGLRVDTVLTTV